MSLLSNKSISETGEIQTLDALTEVSNTFENGGNEFIFVENTSESSITLTVTTLTTTVENPLFGALTKTNPSITIAAGATATLGTFPVAAYNDENGIVTFVVSAYAGVNLGIFYIE